MFFETPTANVGFAEPEKKFGTASFWDVEGASFRSGVYLNYTLSYYAAQEQAYEKRIKAIKQAIPGVTLINPTLIQKYQSLEDDIDREPVDLHEQFKQQLQELAAKHPHLKEVIRPDEDIRSSTALFQREIERDLRTKSELYGTGAIIPQFIGGVRGLVYDPANWAVLPISAGNAALKGWRGLAIMFAKQAAVNAAVEAALQPAIQFNRALAGVDYGVDQAFWNAAMSGIVGGGIDLGGRMIYRGVTGAKGLDPDARPPGATPSDRPPPIEPAPTAEPPRAPDIPPELIARVEKGDLEAAREVIRRSGAEDDPEIQAIEYAITVEDRTQKQIDALVGERIEVDGVTNLDRGDAELRLANAIRAATDDVEPPRVGDTAPATSRVPSISDDDALRAAAKRINKGLDQVTIDGRPAALRQLEAKSLTTDPELFMARGGDTSGVTRWDPESAGRLVVFEGTDGRLIVADGQKRLELAQRLTQDGQDVPPVETIVFREADGWSAREVDDIAIRRSVEESADAMEIARAIRRSPDIVDGRMPLDTDVMQTARGLARLSDEAFAAVEDGTVARHVGAAVGDHVADRAAHRQMLDDLAAAQPNSPAEARMILREMLADHPDNRSRAQEITLGTHHGDAVFAATHGRFRARLFGDLMQVVDADPELRAMLLKEARALDMGRIPKMNTPEEQAAVETIRVALVMERTLVPGSRGAGVLDDAARALAQGFDPDDVRGAMLGRMSKILREDGVAGLARPVGEQRVPGGPGDEVFFAIRAYHGSPPADEPFSGLVPRRTDFSGGPPNLPGIDNLGYFSRAIQAAGELKQAKGTPEQMLAQLKKAGVKDAEIEATGLREFLAGKKSVTREELVDHLETNRTDLREAMYGGEVRGPDGREFADKDAIQRAIIAAEDAGDQTEAERLWGILDKYETKWSEYSLDETNPTYRETVLHLPERAGDGDPNFRSGHWSEPNVIAHMRTSVQTDAQGRRVLVLNELQSDWGQKLRDGGVRDEAKIAELERRIKAMGPEIERVSDRISETQLKVVDERSYQAYKSELSRLQEEYNRLAAPRDLLVAELRTAEAAASGNPLVNTTDQWVNTSLRRLIRQAISDGVDRIAIASGETVDSFGMGAPLKGLQYSYNEMYPKKLRDLLKKIDPEAAKPERVETLVSHDGESQLGKGFTVFNLTDKVRRQVAEQGQPMFARPAYSDAAGASGQRARLPYDTTRTLYTEAAADIMPELRQEIMAVTRILPENVRIEVQDRIVMPIDGGGRAVLDGYFDPVDSIIRVALDSADPRGTVNHEAIHAIKKAGLFTESEWQQIVGYARRNNLRDKFEIDARYGDAYRRMFPDPNRFEEAMIEEVVAHAFAAWRAGERFGSKIDRVIDRIVQFLNRVADVLGMRGFRRADDVFRSIESGEIAGRGASALAPDRTLFSFRDLIRTEPNPGVYDLSDLPPPQRTIFDNHRMTYAAKTATELHGASERNVRIDAVRDLNAGIPVSVSPDAVNVIRTSLEQFSDLLPQGVRFGAVGSITPLDGPGKLVKVGVIRDLSRGNQAATDSIVLPRDVLINSQAIVSRDGRAVLLFNLSGGEHLSHAFRGQVAKVLAESALVRGEIPEGLINRLVRHVRDESPLEKTLGRYASERGDMLDPAIAERTLREYYTLRYKDDPQLDQIMQAKAIGHLVEDYASGRMPENAARYLRGDMEELIPGLRQQQPEADSLQVAPADEAHVRRELTQIERLGDMKDVVEACRR